MLSLILPTYNEAENIRHLLPEIRDVLEGLSYEIIVVDDDSSDLTWKVVQETSENWDNVHVIRRINRRGLSSAVLEGFLSAKGTVLVVMDADGQHDMTLLPKLYNAVSNCGGIAIGSRYVDGGSVGEWDEQRYFMSRVATSMAKRLCKVKVVDPMSGFFAIDKNVFEEVLPRLNPKGFKILLDLLVHVPSSTLTQEFPFTFGVRSFGKSKLSRRVQLEFLEYLYDVSFGKIVPLVFVKYCIVGSLGVIVHVFAFELFSLIFSSGSSFSFKGFSFAVIGAIETAIIFNFILNNIWTFSSAKLQGFSAIVGFLKFNSACLLGALANYAVSAFLFSLGFAELLSVIVGAFTGVFWNYTINRMITWKNL